MPQIYDGGTSNYTMQPQTNIVPGQGRFNPQPQGSPQFPTPIGTPGQLPSQPQVGTSTSQPPPPQSGPPQSPDVVGHPGQFTATGQKPVTSYGPGQFPGLNVLLQGLSPTDPNAVNMFINNRVMATQGRPATPEDLKYWGDAIKAAGGLGDGQYWYNKMTDPNGQGANAGGGGGTGPGSAGMPFSGKIGDPMVQALLQQLGVNLNVGPNDPVIKAMTDAYRSEQTKDLRNTESANAEAAGPISNIGVENRMAQESMAQNTAGYQANLLGQELGARRGMLNQGIGNAENLYQNELLNQQFLDSLGLKAEDLYNYWQSQGSGAGLPA